MGAWAVASHLQADLALSYAPGRNRTLRIKADITLASSTTEESADSPGEPGEQAAAVALQAGMEESDGADGGDGPSSPGAATEGTGWQTAATLLDVHLSEGSWAMLHVRPARAEDAQLFLPHNGHQPGCSAMALGQVRLPAQLSQPPILLVAQASCLGCSFNCRPALYLLP